MNQSWESNKTVELLMVDDDPGDLLLAKKALRDESRDFRMHTVHDGVEALQFLRNEGPYHGLPRPDLILLDLNMPLKDGREVLADIKSDPHLRAIPVVVFTTSDSTRDILQAYDLQANCYVTKPVDLEQFTQTLRAIAQFWLHTARLPRRQPTELP